MNRTVSIIVPVYNADTSVERCIDSILSQTYSLIEVIVINDGSKDKSDLIISDICKDHKNIIYLKQENSGVSAARNNGMSVASGAYMMFVDADDWIERDCVSKMVAAIEASDADYCFSDWFVEQKSGSYVDDVSKDFAPVFAAELLYRFYISNRIGCAPWGKLYKREAIVNHDIRFIEGLAYAEDYLFILNYLSVVDTCVYLNEPLVHYDCTEPGAALKIRENYYQLQVEIERYKQQIVIASPKYRRSDEELIEISMLKSYVSSLLYLQLLHTDFRSSYGAAKTIVEAISNHCQAKFIKASNMRRLDKIYAHLAFTKSAFGISVMTVMIRTIKKLMRPSDERIKGI